MKKRRKLQPKSSRRPGVALIVAALIALGLGGWWLWPAAAPPPGAAPALALDRTEIDLGYLRFNTPAYAAFTITNRGAGPMTLAASAVRVVQGC